MTNQEKDLKNAREYITTHPDYDIYIDNPKKFHKVWGLDILLINHVQHLEKKGIIKRIANRDEAEENVSNNIATYPEFKTDTYSKFNKDIKKALETKPIRKI